MSAAPGLPPRLLALSPGTLREGADARAFARAAAAAFEAGLRGLLVREPALTDRAALALADELVRLARGHAGGWLGVHDRLHVALAAGADGVHLGFRSLMPARAAVVAEQRLVVGYSAHAQEPLAACAGADYLLLGPLFDTPSKRGLKAPLGLERFAAERARLARPTWAIGGLQPEHLAPAFAAGASGVAVLGGIFGHARPAERVRAYLAALG